MWCAVKMENQRPVIQKLCVELIYKKIQMKKRCTAICYNDARWFLSHASLHLDCPTWLMVIRKTLKLQPHCQSWLTAFLFFLIFRTKLRMIKTFQLEKAKVMSHWCYSKVPKSSKLLFFLDETKSEFTRNVVNNNSTLHRKLCDYEDYIKWSSFLFHVNSALNKYSDPFALFTLSCCGMTLKSFGFDSPLITLMTIWTIENENY